MKRALLAILGLVVLALAAAVIYLARWTPYAHLSEEDVIARFGASLPVVPRTDPKVARGEYLVTVTPCHYCHTQQGFFGPVRTLEGGASVRSSLFGERRSQNLTGDIKVGAGAESPATILRSLRSGEDETGGVVERRAMPWDIFSHFTSDDTDAILAYLRRVPPVPVWVGPARDPVASDPEGVEIRWIRSSPLTPGKINGPGTAESPSPPSGR